MVSLDQVWQTWNRLLAVIHLISHLLGVDCRTNKYSAWQNQHGGRETNKKLGDADQTNKFFLKTKKTKTNLTFCLDSLIRCPTIKTIKEKIKWEKSQKRTSTSNFNLSFKLQLQNATATLTSNLNFKLQLQTSTWTSNYNFKLQL